MSLRAPARGRCLLSALPWGREGWLLLGAGLTGTDRSPGSSSGRHWVCRLASGAGEGSTGLAAPTEVPSNHPKASLLLPGESPHYWGARSTLCATATFWNRTFSCFQGCGFHPRPPAVTSSGISLTHRVLVLVFRHGCVSVHMYVNGHAHAFKSYVLSFVSRLAVPAHHPSSLLLCNVRSQPSTIVSGSYTGPQSWRRNHGKRLWVAGP